MHTFIYNKINYNINELYNLDEYKILQKSLISG